MIPPSPPAFWCFGDIEIDPNRLQAKRAGSRIELEPKAFRVLVHLINHRDRVVSKEELVQEVWAGAAVTDNALTRVVAQIRKQLGDDARTQRYIQTATTFGYRFVGEIVPTPAPPPLDPKQPAARAGWRSWSVVAAGVAILLVGIVWWALTSARTRPPQITALEQITTSMALDRWPTFSPDGSQMAFTSDRSGHYQIYTRAVVPGSGDRQVTFDDLDNIQPTWSPNGDYLAYASTKRGGINIIPASGGAIRYRTNFGDSPQWSPDGQSLVFRDPGLRFNPAQDPIDVPLATLWLVNVDHGAPIRLTQHASPPGGHEKPRWVSDGSHVVMETAVLIPPTTPRPDFIPAVIDIHTGKWKAIPFGSIRARDPIISPNRKYLYFEVLFGKQPGLWRARLDDNFQAQAPEPVIPANGPLLRDFAFNAAGTRLAFSQSNDQAALWSVHLNRSGSPTGEPQPLIREHVRRFFSPSFSPDGSKIAYTWVQRDSEWVKMAIYAANADGTGVTPVSPEDQQTFSASWIDANSIGYQVTGKGDMQGYWRKPLAGPAEKVNLRLDWPQSDNVRVRGMQAVADVQGAEGSSVIVRADLAGSQPRSLTPSTRDIGNPSWSPDGQWIAASENVHGNRAVVIFPAEGGEIQTLVNEPGQSVACGWSPDSKRISYAALRDGIWNVYWVDRLSRKVRQLTHFTNPSGLVRDPAWSPRGDQIIFERLDQFANIYVAELGPK